MKKTAKNPLFEKRPHKFGIGLHQRPAGLDLTRYVRWPKYVRLQRQRKIILMRLKVPPAINQFRNPLNKNTTAVLLKLMNKYAPESKLQKKERLTGMAEKKQAGQDSTETKKPIHLKFGINHIVELVEAKKAQLVVIAHDVDPVELVVWLPALCRKMDVPYCIVKGKARLGQVVHQKKVTAVAFTGVRPNDRAEFSKLVENVKSTFNEQFEEIHKRWGGNIMGMKSQHRTQKKERAIAIEEAKRNS